MAIVRKKPESAVEKLPILGGNGGSLAELELAQRPIIIEEAEPVVGPDFFDIERRDGSEKGASYWTALEGSGRLAEIRREENIALAEMMVPEHIVENPERKVWAEDVTVLELDMEGFTGLMEEQIHQTRMDSGSRKVNDLVRAIFGRIYEEARKLGIEPVSFAGDAMTLVTRGPEHRARMEELAARVVDLVYPKGVKINGGLASGRAALGYVELSEKRKLSYLLGPVLFNAKDLASISSEGDITVENGDGKTSIRTLDRSDEERAAIANEAMLAYAASRPLDGRGSSTLEELSRLAEFLHPRCYYDLHEVGLPVSIREGEFVEASIVFVRLRNIEEMMTRVVQEADQNQCGPSAAKMEEILQALSSMAGYQHGILEKVDFNREPKVIFYFGSERHYEAALRMAMRVQEYCQKNGLAASVGVSTDRVYRGVTGALVLEGGQVAESKLEYGFIGDVANVTARLASQAGSGEVLADKKTAGKVEKLSLEYVERVMPIRGREGQVNVIELKAIEEKSERFEHGAEVPLIGREAEMQLLRGLVDELNNTRQQVLVIQAEAGMGKSLLVDHFIKELCFDKQTLEVLKGVSYSYSENGALRPWRTIIKRLLEISSEDDTETRASKLRAKLIEVCPDITLDYIERFASYFSLTENQQELPGGFVFKAADIVAQLLRMREQQKPMALILEDWHWSDPTSADLLSEVIRRTKDLQLMVMLVTRPTEQGQADRLARVTGVEEERMTTMTLGPLTQIDMARLINSHLPIRAMALLDKYERAGDDSWKQNPGSSQYEMIRRAEELRDMFWRHTGGHPYYTSRLLRYLAHYPSMYPDRKRSDGKPHIFLEEHKGGREYRFTDDRITDETLDEVKGMDSLCLRSFQRGLDVRQQRVIKLAAKLGRDFEIDLLEKVTRANLREIYQALYRAQKLGLTERVGEKYSFAHYEAWRAIDSIAAEIDMGDGVILTNEGIARMVGEVIEREYPERIEDLERLFSESDVPEKALHYKMLVGDAAMARSTTTDYQIAVMMYENARKIFEEKLKGQEIDEETKQQIYREVLKILQRDSEAYYKLRKTKKSFELNNRALDFYRENKVDVFNQSEDEFLVLDTEIDQIKLQVMSRERDAAWQAACALEARLKGLLALDGHEPHGGKALCDWIALLQSRMLYIRGYDRSRIEGELDRWLSGARSDVDTRLKVLVAQVRYYMNEGDIGTAEVIARVSIEEGEDVGDRGHLVSAYADFGEVLRKKGLSGDLVETEAVLLKALGLAREWQPNLANNAYANLASFYETAHNFRKALEIMDELLSSLDTDVSPGNRERYLAERLFIAAKLGDFDEEAEQILADLREQSDRSMLGIVLFADAVKAIQAGHQPVEIIKLLESAVTELGAAHASQTRIQVYETYIEYLLLIKDDKEAVVVGELAKQLAKDGGEGAELRYIENLLTKVGEQAVV